MPAATPSVKHVTKLVARKLAAAIALLFIASCATIPDYEPIVDSGSVDDVQKLNLDMAECELVTNRVDYSDEEAVAAIVGAGVGGATVLGVSTLVWTAAASTGSGAVVIPAAVASLPLLAAGIAIGAQKNKAKINAEEQKLRALVWNKCLMERGYTVLSADSDPESKN